MGTQHFVDSRGKAPCFSITLLRFVFLKEALMARLARAEIFASDEIAIVHVTNRVVRRCFLLGDDPVTEKCECVRGHPY